MQYTNTLNSESIINLISRQANELINSEIVKNMLNECNSEQEKREKLLIATLYGLIKANN